MQGAGGPADEEGSQAQMLREVHQPRSRGPYGVRSLHQARKSLRLVLLARARGQHEVPLARSTEVADQVTVLPDRQIARRTAVASMHEYELSPGSDLVLLQECLL